MERFLRIVIDTTDVVLSSLAFPLLLPIVLDWSSPTSPFDPDPDANAFAPYWDPRSENREGGLWEIGCAKCVLRDGGSDCFVLADG